MSNITTTKKPLVFKGEGNPDFIARKDSVYVKTDAESKEDRFWISTGDAWKHLTTNQ